MVFVNAPVEQIERIVGLASVGTGPTKVFSDAAFADKPRPNMNPKPVIVLRQFLRHAFEVVELPALQCRLLLRRLSGQLAHIAVHFDGDTPNARAIVASIRFQNVGVQAFE